ncbi:MAG: hypothetical protein ABI652_05105 [Acidobacteriota bacterium]
MSKKLEAIITRAELPKARATPPLRTSFTDREVNAYFEIAGPLFLPEGVINPQVVIENAGRLRARATVDLDKAVKPKQRSWFDPLAWVSGKVEMSAIGTFSAKNGSGLFALESATLGGVPVPKSLVQEIVGYYSRTPELPQGFDLDKPFPLPSKIRSVETQPGAATIVQ